MDYYTDDSHAECSALIDDIRDHIEDLEDSVLKGRALRKLTEFEMLVDRLYNEKRTYQSLGE